MLIVMQAVDPLGRLTTLYMRLETKAKKLNTIVASSYWLLQLMKPRLRLRNLRNVELKCFTEASAQTNLFHSSSLKTRWSPVFWVIHGWLPKNSLLQVAAEHNSAKVEDFPVQRNSPSNSYIMIFHMLRNLHKLLGKSLGEQGRQHDHQADLKYLLISQILIELLQGSCTLNQRST